MSFSRFARRIILQFRDICLTKFPDDIDPVSAEERHHSVELGHGSEINDRVLPPEYESIMGSVVAIARTPRILKMILRRVWETWDVLHGEVDFDDVLVANTLRFGAPQAFEFLQLYSNRLRALQSGSRITLSADERDKQRADLNDRWSVITDGRDWDSDAARKLAEYLFPQWATKAYVSKGLQGVQVESPTDYWVRLLNERIHDDEPRDQAVLHSMHAWIGEESNGHRTDLVEGLLRDTAFAERVGHFFDPFSAEQTRALASELFSAILKQYGNESNYESAPGFTILSQQARRKLFDSALHGDWVMHEIRAALSTSFHFALNIFVYWGVALIHDTKLKKKLRDKLVAFVKERFCGNPVKFAKVVNPNLAWISYHFSVLYSAEKYGGPGFHGRDWDWFADLLLDAAMAAPQTVLPQIMPFVARHIPLKKPPKGKSEFKYTPDMAKNMFGHATDRLMKVLALPINLDRIDDPSVRAIVSFGQKATKEDLFAGYGPV